MNPHCKHFHRLKASYVSFKVKFTKQHFTLLFMKKSVKPVAGNNLTLTNGMAVQDSCHVDFVLLR